MSSSRLLIGIVAVAMLCTTVLFAQRGRPGGRLENTALELGVLESGKQVAVRSPMTSTILTLVPDGTTVKKGDVLVRLDTSKTEDAFNQAKIDYSTARATTSVAEAALKRAESDAQSAKTKQTLSLDIAKLALNRFMGKNGEFAARVRTAESELRLAEERLKTSMAMREIVEGRNGVDERLKRLELDFQVTEAKTSIDEAKNQLRLLTGPTREHEEAIHKLAVVDAEMSLAKSMAAADRDIKQAKAELTAAYQAMEITKQALKRIERRMEMSVIRAPVDGVATHERVASRTARATIEEGASVRERQTVIRIVDPKSLQLKVSVHESRISRVKVGQNVKIRFDAFPDRVFQGKVVKVNSFPEPTNFLANNIKNYSVFVSIEEPSPGLKIGLTAAAEIELK